MTVLYPKARLHFCYDSLTGLSVGDALGAQFFTVGPSIDALVAGTVPDGPHVRRALRALPRLRRGHLHGPARDPRRQVVA